MDRGHAEYPVMKGFDLEIKGDVAEEDQLNDKASKKAPPKGKTGFDDPDYVMGAELQTVEDGAEKDIEDSYVGDVQGEKVGSKGFDAYNEMVAKGIAADIDINPYNVGESMDRIAAHTETVCKELNSGIAVKGIVGAAGRQLEKMGGSVAEGLRSGTTLGNVGRLDKRARRRAADFVGSHKKATGAALVGGAAGAGAGAKVGVNKLTGDTEEKCSGAPVKVKGIEQTGDPIKKKDLMGTKG